MAKASSARCCGCIFSLPMLFETYFATYFARASRDATLRMSTMSLPPEAFAHAFFKIGWAKNVPSAMTCRCGCHVLVFGFQVVSTTLMPPITEAFQSFDRRSRTNDSRRCLI